MEDLDTSSFFKPKLGSPVEQNKSYYGVTILSVTTQYILEESLKQMKDVLMSPNIQLCEIYADDRLVDRTDNGKREDLFYMNARIYFHEPMTFDEVRDMFTVSIPSTDKHMGYTGMPFGGVLDHCYMKTKPVNLNATLNFLGKVFDLGDFKINSKAKSAAKAD